MNIKILIAAHKQCPLPKDSVYLPVHVGKALHPDLDLGYQPDNEGDNISEKNPYYCELTAVYWAWKNLKCDYVGLVHYRRMFSKSGPGKQWDRILNTKDFEKLCSENDVILPKRRKLYIETVYSHYDHTLYGKHLDDVRDILVQKYPEYVPYFDKKMKMRTEHLFNMYILKKNLFDEYCEWSFDVLAELEKRYDLKSMEPFHARLIGRVGEKLIDLWLMKNNIKYKEVDYVYLGKKRYLKKGISFLMAKFLKKKYNESF